jgi:hypothetical protein
LTAENNPERLVSNNAFVNEIPCRLKKGTSVIKFKIPLGTIWLAASFQDVNPGQRQSSVDFSLARKVCFSALVNC